MDKPKSVICIFEDDSDKEMSFDEFMAEYGKAEVEETAEDETKEPEKKEPFSLKAYKAARNLLGKAE